jgi:hypothetical protein
VLSFLFANITLLVIVCVYADVVRRNLILFFFGLYFAITYVASAVFIGVGMLYADFEETVGKVTVSVVICIRMLNCERSVAVDNIAYPVVIKIGMISAYDTDALSAGVAYVVTVKIDVTSAGI